MKILLTMMMATIISGSAYAACTAEAITECKTEADCRSISTEGRLFYLNATKGHCMVQETGKNDCLAINNQSGNDKGRPATGGQEQTPGNGSTK